MYRIKQIPEDFIVEEMISLDLEKNGHYGYFIMEKREVSTVNACQAIAKSVNLPLKYIGFAGSKDKTAVTRQLISIRYANEKREKIENFRDERIKLAFIGCGKRPISLGDLEGNKFEIVIRDMDNKEIKGLKPIKKAINYFGEQRFSENNAEIGKLIIKKQFKEACEIIKNDLIDRYLEENPNDYPNALRKIPPKILLIYIHAYQSYVFNKTAERYIESAGIKDIDKMENIKIPLIGFDIEYGDGNEESNEKIKKITEDLMQEENIEERDFIIRELPNISSGGGKRDLFVNIDDLKIGEPEEDELNTGKKKIRLSFSLQKGSYATEIIKALFG